MKLKIIPPRPPVHYISSDEISAAEALIMLAHGRQSLSPPDFPTNFSTAAKRRSAPVSDQNPISGSTAHECFTCHKIFSSGQALGGHQTSHRKINQTTHRKIKSSHGGSRPCNAAAAPTSILNMISLCGQKRKHANYEGKIGIKMISDSSDGTNKSGVTSSDEAASSHTRVRLNIDLNLPPAPEFC